MNERGWGWTGSEIRRFQLLEWVAEESVARPGEYVEVKAFYDVRPDQAENRSDVAFDDLIYLTEARLILSGSGIGGIETMAAMLTPHGHDLVERLRAQRAHKGQRRAACRDAMLSWLYAADATIIERMALRDAMLEDPQHGMWLAAPFVPLDLAAAMRASRARRASGGANGRARSRRSVSWPGCRTARHSGHRSGQSVLHRDTRRRARAASGPVRPRTTRRAVKTFCQRRYATSFRAIS